MSHRRITRVNELIRREIGEALFRLVNEREFDMAAVTVTRVSTSPNLRNARVYVSIRDHDEDRDAMMSLLRKHRRELQAQLGRNLTMKYTPRLSFHLDESIERGDHVLKLLSDIEGDPELETNDNPPEE
jgi:ribosome-binding factor A